MQQQQVRKALLLLGVDAGLALLTTVLQKVLSSEPQQPFPAGTAKRVLRGLLTTVRTRFAVNIILRLDGVVTAPCSPLAGAQPVVAWNIDRT